MFRPLMGAGCRECAQKKCLEGWSNSISVANFQLFFPSPPLHHRRPRVKLEVLTPSNPRLLLPPPRPRGREEQGDHRRRRGQDETQEGAPVSQHLAEEDFHGCLHLGTEEKVLRSAGIKVCPGCLSHRGLPQRIQMGFPEKKRGSQPLADLTTQMRQGGKRPAMNTWKSPELLHTKVDQVSVEPKAEVQEGFYFLFFF